MADPRQYLVDGSGTGVDGKLTGGDVSAVLADAFDRLHDNALFWATVTSGAEPDDVAATINSNATGAPQDDRFLARGWQAGMGLRMAWPQANTGGVTLAVNGGAALSIVTPDGAAIPAGALPTGLVVSLVYHNGAFTCTSPLPSDVTIDGRFFYKFEVSTTWVKPDVSDGVAWNVGLWGAGSSGASGVGGPGGEYVQRLFDSASLPAQVAVTIGAGGVASGSSIFAGGDTTFGSFLTANGGGTANGEPLDTWGAGIWRGGASGFARDVDADSFFGGGGGVRSGAVAGVSVVGGNGGTNGVPGAPRGGGGGGGSDGGRGECWIWN